MTLIVTKLVHPHYVTQWVTNHWPAQSGQIPPYSINTLVYADCGWEYLHSQRAGFVWFVIFQDPLANGSLKSTNEVGVIC